jgi:MGT family glycosyltransferase
MTQKPGRHFALFAFPDVGHVLPTLAVVRMLVARGHRVTYVLDEDFAAMAAGAGAGVLGYRSGRRRYGDRSFEDIGSMGIDYLQRIIDVVLPMARASFAADPPDVLVYDYENFAVARLLSRELGAASVQFSPYLASNEQFSLRGEMFEFDFDNELVKRTVEILTGFLADNAVPPEEIWTFAAEFDERNLVFLPQRFQVRGDTFDERFAFVGPCAAPAAAPSWSPPAGSGRTVLISLGTEANDQPELLKTCATAFAGTDWHVVMTLGRGKDTAAMSALAPNIEAHEWLPHTAVLPRIDAFVCHAGMTSLMEALSYGVPIVAVPPTFENLLNSRQVADLGLGRWLDPETVTSAAVREAVEHVVQDAEIRRCLDRMRDDVEAAGGAPRACEFLEAAC